MEEMPLEGGGKEGMSGTNIVSAGIHILGELCARKLNTQKCLIVGTNNKTICSVSYTEMKSQTRNPHEKATENWIFFFHALEWRFWCEENIPRINRRQRSHGSASRPGSRGVGIKAHAII